MIDLEKQLARKRKLIAKHQTELKALLDTCQHPAEKVTKKEHYYSGGYYNRPYVEYWWECSICGECSDGNVTQITQDLTHDTKYPLCRRT